MNNQQLSNLSYGLLYGKELTSGATFKPEQTPIPGEVIGLIGKQLLLFCSIDVQITVPSKHLYLDSLIALAVSCDQSGKETGFFFSFQRFINTDEAP